MEIYKGDFRIGVKCRITENSRVLLGLIDDVEYTIKDILQDYIEYPIVLKAEEFGENWYQFFRSDELIFEC